MAPRREVGFSWHPTVSRGLSVARSLALPQIRGCSPLMTRVEYKENEWLPCDESGRIDDGYGNEPNATVAYLSSLEGSREERAFELAKNEYLAWLEHKEDRYTTVYGYMD